MAGVVGLAVYALGSLQYAREHHDHLLKQYYVQIGALSRFPETDPHPVFKLDREGNVLYANPAVRQALRELELPEDDWHEILPADCGALVRGCLEDPGNPCEAEVSAHGRIIHYTFSPFPDERSVIAAGMDVTYLKKIEQDLRNLNQNLEQMVEARTEELRETQDCTILCLAGLAETRDPDTGRHLERTRRYVKVLAEHLRDHPRFSSFLTERTIEKLYKSAPLHDIGKVGLRDGILLKEGHLTPEEYEEMKKHPIYGGDALRWAEERLGFDSFLGLGRDIAYYHHEWWDGTGYPFGLKGEDIPHAARLMALADAYDALTSKRVYKEPFPHAVTRDFLVKERGKHFDPAVVDAFLEAEQEFISIAESLAE
jgi:response regulator RpfG family c-di-GMP phosphodiesterase